MGTRGSQEGACDQSVLALLRITAGCLTSVLHHLGQVLHEVFQQCVVCVWKLAYGLSQ